MAGAVPHRHRVVVGRVDALSLRVDAAQLAAVEAQQLRAAEARRPLVDLRLRERRHLVVLAGTTCEGTTPPPPPPPPLTSQASLTVGLAIGSIPSFIRYLTMPELCSILDTQHSTLDTRQSTIDTRYLRCSSSLYELKLLIIVGK